MPNTNICYIQFPKDISTLIKAGLNIKYTISRGLNGNIKANTLVSFFSEQEQDGNSLNEHIRIMQPTPATNGEDPESIEDAYHNYRKVMTTFNTLVTKKDYENYLYKYSFNNEYICSNLVVADRTNDLNYSHYVQAWNNGVDYKKLYITQSSKNITGPIVGAPGNATVTVLEDYLNAYNIVLYLLNPQLSVYDEATYNSSFEPAHSTADYIIEDALGDIKSSQHDILFAGVGKLESQPLFNFENLLTLRGQLITYHKVTKAEAGEIEKNVRSALYQAYNARKVNFGEELDYNTLIDIIINADSRIRNIILNNTQYTVNKQGISGVSTPMTDLDNSELVARMALSGNLQLFKFDEDFEYEFGQTDVAPITYTNDRVIKAITSEANITVPTKDAESVKLHENEVLQIFAPSLITTTEYSTYVKYYFYKIATDATEEELQQKDIIPANTNYQIKPGEVLKLYYVDTDKQGITVDLVYPAIICANIPLTKNNIAGWDAEIDLPTNTTGQDAWYENSKYYRSLSTGKYIQVKAINESKLNYGTKYYFKLNNPTNTLAINKVDESGAWIKQDYILQENEYFIYSNNNSSEMIILGSGTQLSLPTNYVFNYTLPDANLEDLTEGAVEWLELGKMQDIATYGSAVIGAVQLITTDLDIYSLGQDTYIRSEQGQTDIKNTASKLNTPFEYSVDGEDWVTLLEYDIDGVEWQVQSRLNINANLTIGQYLQPNHTLKFYFGENSLTLNEEVIKGSDNGGGWYVRFNHPVILSGGVNLDTRVLNYYGELDYSLVAYRYRMATMANDITRSPNGLLALSGPTEADIKKAEEEGISQDTVYTLPFNFDTYHDVDPVFTLPAFIVPVYVHLKDEKASLTISYNNGKVYKYNPLRTQLEEVSNITGPYSGFMVLYFSKTNTNTDNITTITFKEGSTASSYISIGKINLLTEVNSDEINCSEINGLYNLSATTAITGSDGRTQTITNLEYVLQKIFEIDKDKLFNWAYRVPDSDKVLSPTRPSAYWEANHIYRTYTIPKINFNTYKINVNSSNIS